MMKQHIYVLLTMAISLSIVSCNDNSKNAMITSPSGDISIDFGLSDEGAPTYSVSHKGNAVIERSSLGFTFTDQAGLKNNLKVTGTETGTTNETWEMPWGEQREVVNHYNALRVSLEETAKPGRKIELFFRAYDDGVAFRYHFPQQEGFETAFIDNELSEFQLTGDHTCWWIPGDWESYEHLYNTTKFSEIDALSKKDHPNLVGTLIKYNSVNTPVTMRTSDGLHLSFHEAALTDYSGMTLEVDPTTYKMTSRLVESDLNDHNVKRDLPFSTPWRMIQISEDAAGLIDSRLVLNLNDPNELGDVSWFKPKKYIGVWWEMHLGIATWDLASGRHGATTENTKRYIDFAAENDIGGVLVEGWNTGWERWIGFPDREGVFDFITPYEDYDLEGVAKYAQEKGVEIIMHHETSAAPRTYDKQMEAAYQLMDRLGIRSVKTGYVGPLQPKGEYHHGQWMVNHYRRALETAAKYNIAINAHEPIKPTGIRRTFPNAISREGLRGQEFNAWSREGGNPPEHLPIVAFTRMLAGPIDFTPGVFDIKLSRRDEAQRSQINTTLAQQLALYVVIYSPIQMACDLPEFYEGQPAFQFIRDVGVDWEQSITLNGEVGEYVTIAREERGTGDWFVGSITNETARDVEIDFSFLPAGQEFRAVVYGDTKDAHWNDNPTSIQITEEAVNSTSKRIFKLAPGGGLAISLNKI